MRYLKRRHIEPAFYDARSQAQRIIETHRMKRCSTCTYEFPEADVIVEDGQERCPMCKDTITAAWHANEESNVAWVKAESARRLIDPPQITFRSDDRIVGVVTLITDSAGNVLSQSSPLLMPRNSAKAVLLKGQHFSTLCTITYPTGLSDSSAPVITPTLMTLSVIAAIGMATGQYGFTFNDGVTQVGHSYNLLFAVR